MDDEEVSVPSSSFRLLGILCMAVMPGLETLRFRRWRMAWCDRRG